jgi:hypothetical protein
MSRIYRITLRAIEDHVRYVRASNGARALRAVTAEMCTVSVVSASELYEATKQPGFEVLEADGDDEPEAPTPALNVPGHATAAR